ncbi:unnamed protein product, partial [Bubo scandiacus]
LVNEHEIFKARRTAQPSFTKMFISSEKEISTSLLHLALQQGSYRASPFTTCFILMENS